MVYHSPTLELWTLQHPLVYDQLRSDGVCLVDSARISFPEEEDSQTCHLNAAYQWLVAKMDEKLSARPKGAVCPIWAWYKQCGREDGKPDMRFSGYAQKGSPLVRMNLEVPDGQVLLSDFSEWHFALSYSYLSRTERDDEAFEAKYTSLGIDFHQLGDFSQQTPTLARLRKEIVASWDYMLDVFAPRDEYWSLPWVKREIQATFWQLRIEHVKSAEYFIAR